MSPSPYDPGASLAGSGASPPAAPDTQMLIGLLGNLMPLLLQIQSQCGPLFQSGTYQSSMYPPGMYQPSVYQTANVYQPGMPGPAQPFGGPLNPDANVAAPSPMLDHRAAVSLVEDITGDRLRTLSAYLETYATRYQGLESCVPIVTHAARCFAMRDYAQTLALIWQAYRVITALRAANPQLPPPRSVGLADAQFQSTSAIVH